MRASYIIAIVVAAAAIAWIASGQFEEAPVLVSDQPAGKAKKPQASQASLIPKVRVRTSVAAQRSRRLVFLGRTEASRKVSLKAETSGRIVAVPAAEGSRVRRGNLIVRLAIDDRRARFGEAEAVLRQRRMEYQAARELTARKFRSKVKLAEAEANLEAAKAGRARAAVEIRRTAIVAPFDGILDARVVEVGDFVKIGNPVATFIDLTPIRVTGHVSELNIGRLTTGMKAAVKLVDGKSAEGVIRFVASEAHETTRTFKIQVEIANAGRAMVAGMTAEISIPLAPVAAHKVSPAVLGLSDAGQVGIKTVGADGRVQLHGVDIIDEDSAGIWITGRDGRLSARVTLITVGHEFVKAGQAVQPFPEKDPALTKLGGDGS
ncbi:MAG: efflux RND transporter periplasmic adaptor subunit [Rhodospirillales bacterium]